MAMFGNLQPKNMFGGLAPYSQRMMMAGLGLMSGNNWQEGAQGAMRGLIAGGEMDDERNKKKRQQQALDAFAQSGNFAPGDQALMSAFPDLAVSVAGDRMKPQSDDWDKLDDNTLYRKGSGETREVGGPQEANPATIANITTIRKDFESQPGTSRYRMSQPIVQSMSESIDDNSAMSDFDFVYGLAQILDPQSVVREAEAKFVTTSQSVPEELRGRVAKALSGEATLGPQVRRDLVRIANRRAGVYRKQAEGESQFFRGIAGRHNIPFEDITRELEELPDIQQQQMQQPAPQGGFDLDEQTIPEGATVQGEDGKTYRKVNGQMVPVT